jgi:molecular chaperone GrpE
MARRKASASQPKQPPHSSAHDARVAELTNALLQERADAINLRRRHEEQLAKVRASVKAAIIAELIPVIDNIERAMNHVPPELESNDYVKGIQQIAKQFDKALEDLGIARIETVGHEFDPRFHEAVMVEPGEGVHEIISEELRAGYRLGDEVIRHAMVKVQPQ